MGAKAPAGEDGDCAARDGRCGGRWVGEHAGVFARGDVVAVGGLAVADILDDDGAVDAGVVAPGFGTIW